MNAPNQPPTLAHNVSRIAHLDLPGAGQVYVDGKYAYVGHITNKEGLSTSILDVSDPRMPRVVSQIAVGDPNSHSHKARVIGDITAGKRDDAAEIIRDRFGARYIMTDAKENVDMVAKLLDSGIDVAIVRNQR